VLQEVGCSIACVRLKPTARVDPDAQGGGFRERHVLGGHTQAIGQRRDLRVREESGRREGLIWNFSRSFSRMKREGAACPSQCATIKAPWSRAEWKEAESGQSRWAPDC